MSRQSNVIYLLISIKFTEAGNSGRQTVLLYSFLHKNELNILTVHGFDLIIIYNLEIYCVSVFVP